MIGLLPSRGRVLVELVDHGEQQAAGAGRLLAGGFGGEHDADHEPLRPVRQVVQVDDGDLLVGGGDLPGAGVRQVAADEVARAALSDDRSRRMNALTVPSPVTGPAQCGRVASSVSWSTMRSTRSS